MSEQKLEYCCCCDSATGRAGPLDDSIYDEVGGGPYCWECWEKRRPPESDS